MTNNRRLVFPALLAAGVLWGTTVPLSKVALGWLPPGWLALTRFALAAAVLLVAGRSHLRSAFSPAIMITGAVGYGGSVLLQNFGIEQTSVTHAALLIGATPVLVAIMAAVLRHSVARPQAWAGFAISLAGVGFIAGGQGSGSSLAGDGLVLAAQLISAGFTVSQARLLRARDPIAVTGLQLLGAAIVVLPVALITEHQAAGPANSVALLATIGLVLAGTVLPTSLFAFGQSRVPADVAGAFLNLEPLIGAIMGMALFAEPAGFPQLSGGAGITVGIGLSSFQVVRSERRRGGSHVEVAAGVVAGTPTAASGSGPAASGSGPAVAGSGRAPSGSGPAVGGAGRTAARVVSAAGRSAMASLPPAGEAPSLVKRTKFPQSAPVGTARGSPHLRADALPVIPQPEPRERADLPHRREISRGHLLHAHWPAGAKYAQVQRPVFRRPRAPIAPLPLEKRPGSLGGRRVRPPDQERGCPRPVQAGRREVGKFAKFLVSRQAQLETRGREPKAEQGPVVGEHASLSRRQASLSPELRLPELRAPELRAAELRAAELRPGATIEQARGVASLKSVGIVGAGIVGLAVGRELITRFPGIAVTVLEKEDRVAAHQSGHNSGVVHAGVYYLPGSLKATLCRRGTAMMREFCQQHEIRYHEFGKLIVAASPAELPGLARIEERAISNQVPGIRRVPREEIAEIEPHIEGTAGLYSPHTAAVDYVAMCEALASSIGAAGGKVVLGTPITAVRETSSGVRVRVRSSDSTFEFDYLIVCAGLNGDHFASSLGRLGDLRTIPFRGEYYQLAPEARDRVRGMVYPVPDPRYPFLGVHLTRRVDDTVYVGPNAVLALALEGYRWSDVSFRDVAAMARWPGAWQLARQHWRSGLNEVSGSLSKRRYLASVRAYLPDLQLSDLVRSTSGVRAQAVRRDGSLEDDFVLQAGGRVLLVRNAPSPAATASLAIAEHIVSAVSP